MSKFVYLENPKRCAFDALQKPEDFGYWGPENTFKTWGFCGIHKHSQSTLIEQANYEAISKHLKSRYPNDVRTESFTHWAVGDLEQLVVRVVNLPDDYDSNLLEEYLQDESNITNVFMEVLEYLDGLSEDPIYDEDTYLGMLLDYGIETVKFWAELNPSLVDMPDDKTAEEVVRKLHDHGIYLDSEYSDEEIMHGFYHLCLWNPQGKDKWFEWCDNHNLPRPPFDLESISNWNPNQLNLFDKRLHA